MTNKCFIHIGAEKCGSTTIQKSLEINHKILKKNKILSPRGLGRGTAPLNHTKLVVLSYEDNHKDDLTEYFFSKQKKEDFIKNCQKQIKLKENLIKANKFSIILSAEHFSSRLKGNRIGNFKKLINNFSSNFKIILIVRNQIDWHISAYNTYIRCGGKKSLEDWLEISIRQKSADWYLKISSWLKYFKEENISVLPLRDNFKNISLEDRFYKSCEISNDVLKDLEKPPRMNESLNSYLLEKIRIINNKMPWMIEGLINKERIRAIEIEKKIFEEKTQIQKEDLLNNLKFIDYELKDYIKNAYKENNLNLLKKFPHLEMEIERF